MAFCFCNQKSINTSLASKMENQSKAAMDTAILGNGCFWCTEAIFQQLKGVHKVTSGYSGGNTENPSYEDVCAGLTGHAECLNIEYDSSIIKFEDLLQVFWKTHDPTTLNRQGADEGTQYRSVVFYRNSKEKDIAEAYIKQLDSSKVFSSPIVTSVEPYSKFYPAEGYHQNYYNQNGQKPYCRFVIQPKVDKFKKDFKDKLKD